LGLFDTTFIHVDFEYSVRVTTLKAQIAWNTALLVMSLRNADSNSLKYSNSHIRERFRIRKYYDHVRQIGLKINNNETEGMSLFTIIINRLISKSKRIFKASYYPNYNVMVNNILFTNSKCEIEELYKISKKYLKLVNEKEKSIIYC
jgi:hypothetical protein